MSRTQKYLLSGLLCLLLCLGGYLLYQRQQLKAPATSLTMTQTAVTNHDWLGANEHMDLEALYAQAFDEIVVPSLQKRNNGVISAVARDILHRMRGIFVDTMVDYTKTLIEAKDRKKVAPPTHVFAKRFLELTHLQYCSLISIEDTTENDDIATVKGTIQNSLLNKTFPVALSLKKLPNGTWKFYKIDNLEALLVAMEKAQDEKLVVLNQPLQAKIKQEIAITGSSYALKTREQPWQAVALIYQPTFQFLSEKAISSFMGQIQVLDKIGKVLYTQKYIETGPFTPQAKQAFVLRWTLNPTQPKEKALIETKGEGLTIKENILGVIFTDGTSVKLLESLPDANKN